jgi:hypothetical protein
VAQRHRVRVAAAQKAAATRAARRQAAGRKARALQRAASVEEDFEDYEIEIAVDYVPAGRR